MFDLICFATLPPNSNKERQHHLMERFVGMGAKVLWVEPMGNINHPPRLLIAKILRRLSGGHQRSLDFGESVPSGIVPVRLLYIPWHNQPLIRRINRALLAGQIRRLKRRHGLRRPVFWSYYPSDNLLDLQQDFSEAPWVYDCAQRLRGSADVPSYVLDQECEFSRRADVVFADSITIRADQAEHNDQTFQVPQGVDAEFFATAWREPAPTLPDLAGIQGPIIGYVGGIHHSIDLDLIAFLAKSRPGWNFVLVGPLLRETDALAGLGNVHLLGPRPYAELPKYLAHFDVGLIPYKLNPFTEGVFPTKMLEYLASGRAVVSTDLPDVRGFSEHIRIARDYEAFLRSVEQALEAEHSPEVIARYAAGNTWEARFDQIITKLQQLPALSLG